MTGQSSLSTPLPSIPAIPTESAVADPEDPLGWTYCYDGGYFESIGDPDWYSQFSGSIVGTLSNDSNCKQDPRGWAPASVVQQASFLLETTIAFVTGAKTRLPNALQDSKDRRPTASTIDDPFQETATPSLVSTSQPTRVSLSVSPTKQSTRAIETHDHDNSVHVPLVSSTKQQITGGKVGDSIVLHLHRMSEQIIQMTPMDQPATEVLSLLWLRLL